MPAAVRGRASVAIAGLVLGSARSRRPPARQPPPARPSSSPRSTAAAGTPAPRSPTTSSNSTTSPPRRWTSRIGLSSTTRAASATPGGTCTIGSGSIAPGGFFLVQLAGSTNGVALPTPDSSCSSPNLSGTTGSVELANPAGVVDLVGYGAATDLAVRLVRPRPGGRRTPGAGAQPEVAGSSLLTVGAPGTIRGPLLLESP